MRITMAALLGLGIAAGARAEEALRVDYVCDGGAAISVVYLNPPGGDSYAVVGRGGVLVPMKAGPTGSGVRYVTLGAAGPEGPLIWHAKGDEGFLAHDDAGETMIAGGCVAKR